MRACGREGILPYGDGTAGATGVGGRRGLPECDGGDAGRHTPPPLLVTLLIDAAVGSSVWGLD